MKWRVPGSLHNITIDGMSAVLLITALLLGWPCISLAAGVEVLPSQQSPQLSAPPPPPLSSQHEETIPPRLPMRLGSNTREIPLPTGFRGCWSGSVPVVDTIRPLQEGEPPIIWLTKLYTLCYRQRGTNGKWELTFADNSVADTGRVSDQRQVIKVKAVPAPDEAELSAYLHFRAESIGMFGMPNGNLNTMDELADLHCRMTPDREAIEVEASVFVESNAAPYAEMTWHTRLDRTNALD
ncbi:MAG TPA: hypothetical protein VHY56_03780 [Candidatus Binataceae bacterium]|nr:hypothetical protein [Candidatus Binataceae bacterium]